MNMVAEGQKTYFEMENDNLSFLKTINCQSILSIPDDHVTVLDT